MKIDVEKIKTAYEAASTEQKEQIKKMFPGAFECAKSKDSEETLETLVDKLKAWQDQNNDKRAANSTAADKDRTKEEGNTAICIVGLSEQLLQLAWSVFERKDIKSPFAKLFAYVLESRIKG